MDREWKPDPLAYMLHDMSNTIVGFGLALLYSFWVGPKNRHRSSCCAGCRYPATMWRWTETPTYTTWHSDLSMSSDFNVRLLWQPDGSHYEAIT